MLASFFEVFAHIVLPVLAIAALGGLIQWWKPLDVATLARLNLYLFVPAFLFLQIFRSTLSWHRMGVLGLAALLPMLLVGVTLAVILRRRKTSGRTIAAITVGGIFFNAGNFGLPVAELAFGATGAQVQSLLVMVSNLATFLAGYLILAAGLGRGMRSLAGLLRLPYLYVIAAALAARAWEATLPVWAEKSLDLIATGMIPLALVTLGAQLAGQARWPRWNVVGTVMLVKLCILPAVTALLLVALDWSLETDLWPDPGVILVIAAAAPTAVNTLLLTVDLEGDAETAAACVFWTTLGSAVSVGIILTLLRHVTDFKFALP